MEGEGLNRELGDVRGTLRANFSYLVVTTKRIGDDWAEMLVIQLGSLRETRQRWWEESSRIG